MAVWRHLRAEILEVLTYSPIMIAGPTHNEVSRLNYNALCDAILEHNGLARSCFCEEKETNLYWKNPEDRSIIEKILYSEIRRLSTSLRKEIRAKPDSDLALRQAASSLADEDPDDAAWKLLESYPSIAARYKTVIYPGATYDDHNRMEEGSPENSCAMVNNTSATPEVIDADTYAETNFSHAQIFQHAENGLFSQAPEHDAGACEQNTISENLSANTGTLESGIADDEILGKTEDFPTLTGEELLEWSTSTGDSMDDELFAVDGGQFLDTLPNQYQDYLF
ncbi:hypothetical protein L873DRAFT_1786875 [Choiromyces venosus 120613-1]|uniref:Uncharacterized protein n=1 Tax=Choiromyces venosus 120613-1 TaxID=1336337 RepID=A0A3N4K1N0_9PEZI|nr:hypothetical protein L873DRAFT_1786875 [Choiromyces venosus 120613-1]